MNKRTRNALLLIITLCLSILLLIFWWKGNPHKLTAISAVPKNTALFLENTKVNENSLSKVMFSLPILDWRQQKPIKAFLLEVDNFWTKNGPAYSKSIVGLRAAGMKGMVPFVILECPEIIAVNQLKGTANLQDLSMLRGIQTYETKDSLDQRLVLAIYQNLAILSADDFAVEDVIRQIVDETPIRRPPMVSEIRYHIDLLAMRLELSAYLDQPGNLLKEDWGHSLIIGERQVDSIGTTYRGVWRGVPSKFIGGSKDTLTPLLNVAPGQCALAHYSQVPRINKIYSDFFADSFWDTWDRRSITGQFSGLDDDGRAIPFSLYSFESEDSLQILEQAIEHTGELEPQTYQLFEIRQLVGEIKLPHSYFGKPQVLHNPYFVQYENYWLWTTNLSAMKRWLDDILVGDVLLNQPIFKHQIPNVRASFFLYVDPLYLTPFTESILKAGFGEIWTKNITGPSWWIAGGGDIMKPQAGIRGFQLKRKERSFPVLVNWQTPLETFIEKAPQPVKIDGSNLILVQDADHQLYGLDEDGQILWKKQLDSRVLSDFQKVQLYNNSSEQIIFNTYEKLYFINRKGENVPGYPIELPATATNGVKVIRFNDRQDFAYFFACADSTVYALDRLGKALPGWDPKKDFGQVIHPVEHFQLPGKDFIVLVEGQTLHVFKRDGTYRFSPQELIGPFLNGPKYQLHPLSNRIVLCSTRGRASVVNTEGSSFGLQLPVGENQMVEFELEDLVGDGRKDYLVLSDRDIKGYRYEGNDFAPFMSFRFPEKMDGLFVLSTSDSEKGIATYSSKARKIYLLNKEGLLFDGFPLAGDTEWFIFRNDASAIPLAVVGLGADVYAYDLSRSLEY